MKKATFRSEACVGFVLVASKVSSSCCVQILQLQFFQPRGIGFDLESFLVMVISLLMDIFSIIRKNCIIW